jgi:hypothetical protein
MIAIPKREKELPARKNVRTDNMLPRLAMSRRLMELPNLTIPYNEIALPSRA